MSLIPVIFFALVVPSDRLPADEVQQMFDDRKDAYLGNGPAWSYETCPIPTDVRQGCSAS
jgi:hypothetical protein